MSTPEVVLDTDILSALMRQNHKVVAQASLYLKKHGRLTFSIITRYEILRGLKARRATRQLANFERLCSISRFLALTDDMIVQAADTYADLYKRGELIPDADILIAASALTNGLGLVTNNKKHFRRISGLHVENWKK
jgi:tRNA(fMet)-specific endonuclease VapC